MNTFDTHKISNKQAGFSMLEVLITVFVLSIGLLGIAGMQATSIKLSHESHLRSQASLLAYDMADRMRTNSLSAINGDYNQTLTGTSNYTNNCAVPGASCTPTQLAAVDLANWDFKLGETFPGVQAIISTVLAQGETIGVIQLFWLDTESDNPTDQTNRVFRLRTTL